MLLKAEGREVKSFLMAGGGSSRQLDTYLSPLEYKGYGITVLGGRERMTRMAKGRISYFTQLQGVYSSTWNPAKTAQEWGGRLAYDAGWHYNWYPVKGLNLKAGALIGADAGFLYNARNGNNPVQGRLGVDVSLSAGGSYSFRIHKLPMMVRYQADIPLAGCMFSPQYGQSYYEIWQGKSDHNVVFSHPGNAFSHRHLLAMDFIFNRTTMRIGYLGDVRESNVNGIRTNDVSHSFVLGYVRYFRVLKRNERKEDTGK